MSQGECSRKLNNIHASWLARFVAGRHGTIHAGGVSAHPPGWGGHMWLYVYSVGPPELRPTRKYQKHAKKLPEASAPEGKLVQLLYVSPEAQAV